MARWGAAACAILWVCGGCTGGGGEGPPDAGPAPDAGAACAAATGDGLYETRIKPLIESDHVQSCNACHLSGLDLSAFVRETPCATMACLEASDMVRFDAPEQSKVLELIARGFDAPPYRGITAQSVQKEYDGFLAWIEFAAQCHSTACGDVQSDCAPVDGTLPDAGLGDDAGAGGDGGGMPPAFKFEECSGPDLVHTFETRIWRWHGRCDLCHVEGAPLSSVGEPPPWMVYAYAEGAAETTYNNIVAAGYIDETCPLQSLMLLKPLDESLGGIEHGGGSKFHDLEGDEGYSDWLFFLRKYAKCHGYEGEPGTTLEGSCF